MPQQVRIRPQKTLAFSANNLVTETLSRGTIYRELMVRLRCAPTVTAGNNTRAKTNRGDGWAVVKKLEVVLNGTEIIRTYSGNDLWWLNYFLYGKTPNVTTTLGDGATANPTIDDTLIIPFWMPRSIRPMDTALDTTKLSQLEVRVTWGTYTDISDDASAWTTQPTLKVYSHEVFNLSGEFGAFRNFPIEKTITATTAEFEVDLPLGPMYRGFMLNTTDGGVDEGDIVNSLKIVSGTTVFFEFDGLNTLQEYTRQRYALENNFDLGGAIYDPPQRSADAAWAGWYYVDIVGDGYMTECIDSAGLSELKIKADVTVGAGTTLFRVVPMQVWPVRNVAKAAA